MSYIGRGIDQIDNISTLDNLSFNGSSTTFNLTQNSVAFVPVSADALQIQIDGVIQSGNYTVSGSTVTFDFTPSGSSVCNGIKHFGVGIITSVSDGAVTSAKLGNNSVGITQLNVSDGSNGQALTTNGSGTLAFSSVSADADNYFATSGLSNKDLGNGLHIKTNDTGGTVSGDADELVLEGSAESGLTILGTNSNRIFFGDASSPAIGWIRYFHNDNHLDFGVNDSERMRIISTGNLCFGKTSDSFGTSGVTLYGESGSEGVGQFTGSSIVPMQLNRTNSDGYILSVFNDGSFEGGITFSGGTITYSTFVGSHWTRLADNSKPTILRGTVMESIATMCDWYEAVAEVEESTDSEGNVTPAHKVKECITLPNGKSEGDAVTFTSQGKEYTGTYVKETNQQLPMSKISNTEDSKAVYGVFMGWDDQDNGLNGDVNDMNIASLGAYVVRIHKDETVAIGDYLQSKGDGTAKKQADDILRASTIAKVTSTEKTHTYDDGSYCVPCTLHCG